MSFSFKIFPVVALALALAPLAVQAQAVRVSPIAPSSATIDNPTIVHSGVGVNSFPDSFGG
jgi:hypothetical protein